MNELLKYIGTGKDVRAVAGEDKVLLYAGDADITDEVGGSGGTVIPVWEIKATIDPGQQQPTFTSNLTYAELAELVTIAPVQAVLSVYVSGELNQKMALGTVYTYTVSIVDYMAAGFKFGETVTPAVYMGADNVIHAN